MNTRSRSAHLSDVHYISRNAIKSKTSKSSASHLARAQNFKKIVAYSITTTVILEAVNLNLQYMPIMKVKIKLLNLKKEKTQSSRLPVGILDL